MDVSIGLCTAASALGLGIDKTAQIVSQIGFDGVDFQFPSIAGAKEKIETPETEQRVLKIADDVKATGLKISQSHLHYLPGDFYGDGLYPKHESEFLPSYIKEIEFCGKIGCPTAVIHLYFEDSKKVTVESNKILLNKLLPHLEKHNVTLLMENVFAGGEAYADCHYTTADDIMEYVDMMNHPLIGVCLDTGHAVATKQDAVQMIKTYGKHLKGLHINSNAGRDMHLLPGYLDSWLDPNDYALISKTLKEVGYKGPYNLEIGAGNWPNKPMSGVYYLQLVHAVASGFAAMAD